MESINSGHQIKGQDLEDFTHSEGKKHSYRFLAHIHCPEIGSDLYSTIDSRLEQRIIELSEFSSHCISELKSLNIEDSINKARLKGLFDELKVKVECFCLEFLTDQHLLPLKLEEASKGGKKTLYSINPKKVEILR